MAKQLSEYPPLMTTADMCQFVGDLPELIGDTRSLAARLRENEIPNPFTIGGKPRYSRVQVERWVAVLEGIPWRRHH